MIIESPQEFCQFLRKDQIITAIDYGQKKIGMSISCPNHKMSIPHKLFTFKNETDKIKTLSQEILSLNACALVIGLPVNMDGTKGEQALKVEEFAKNICKEIDIAILLQDERLSSKAADNLLKIFGLNRKQRNERDDLTAASLILETVLNRIALMSR